MPSIEDFSLGSFLPDAESTQLQLDGFVEDSTAASIPIRSTAQKSKYPWRKPEAKPTVTTSEVKRSRYQFPGFDYESDDSALHERPRGYTPQPIASSPAPITVNMGTPGHDSLYEITQTPTASFLKAARERVAKEEQQRDIDAVASRLTRISPTKSNTSESRRSRFSHYKKPSSQDADQTSAVLDLTAKPSPRRSRFSTVRAATSPISAAGTFSKPSASPERNHVVATTPQHHPARPTTPRSTGNTMGITQQSFGLPDLPNLTELMSGMYKDGTPIFSRSAKAKSRFSTHTSLSGRKLQHAPVENVPVPEDEKAIYASLQLMKEKVAQLEQEKAEADKRLEDQESELIELRVQLDAQTRMRRSDSGFGSDDDNKVRRDIRTENTQLLAALESTQKKLAGVQRKLEVNDIALKRVTKERDTAVTQLGAAFYNSEELKAEQEALQKENKHLRDEVDQARVENDELSIRHSERHRAAIERSTENELLKKQIYDITAQHDEETQRMQLEEADARQKAEEKTQREHSRLQREKEDIQTRLADALANHEEQGRRWEAKHTEMQSQIEELEETTQQVQTATLSQAAQDLRKENAKLKNKLANRQQQSNQPAQVFADDIATLNRELEDVMTRHEEDSLMWSRKEAQLKEKIARLKTGKSILKKPSANTASQRVEKFASLPKISPQTSAKPASSKKRVVSARVVRTSDYDDGNSAFMSGGLPASSAKHDRRVTAPILSSRTEATEWSDNESTTDLDLSQLQHQEPSQTTKPASNPKASGNISRQYECDDTTTLSIMEPFDIQKIRREVEEQYRLKKQKERVSNLELEGEATKDNTFTKASGLERSARSPSATQQHTKQTSFGAASGLERSARSPSAVMMDAGASEGQTVQSSAPTHARRRSSSKQNGSLSSAQDVTVMSIRSFKSAGSAGTVSSRKNRMMTGVDFGQYLEAEYGPNRRRCSAPEMTSAFILPDITMRVPSAPACDRATTSPVSCHLTDGVSSHDTTKCTVCYRLAVEDGKQDLSPPGIPQPKPVTDEPQSDPDATMRPAMSPTEALATVLKQLDDELAHKKSELKANVNLLDGHDPRKQSRFRRGIQAKIDSLNDEIRQMSQKIYHLMDVLEGQKDAGQLARTATDDDNDTTFSGLSDTGRL